MNAGGSDVALGSEVAGYRIEALVGRGGKRVRGALRRVVAQKLLDQAVAGDDLVRALEQQRQQSR